MPRESFIVAVSGQPTKNLGATIINAGNTPAGIAGTNDATSNIAGFGVLTGSNSGKSSGSKVVEREAIPGGSGQLQCGPGVQPAVWADPFAGSPLGQVIGKSFSWKDQYTGRLPVRWNHIYRRYPQSTVDKNRTTRFAHWTGKGPERRAISRDMDSLFGTNVSLTMGSKGIAIAVGAPSGINNHRGYQAGYNPVGIAGAPSKYGREGDVTVDEFGLHGIMGNPGSPSLGHLGEDGFATRGEEADWYSCGPRDNWLCPEVTPGFDHKGQKVRYNDVGSDRLTAYPKHRVSSSGTGYGHAVTFNSGGTRMAVGAPYADGERGEVTVYEFASGSGTRGEWIRVGAPITGNNLPADRFGWSICMDSDGDDIWVGAPRPGGTGYVAHYSLQGTYPGGATWKRDNHGGSVSGVGPRDKFGYSISCNKEGSAVAVGAPNASGTRGTVSVYHRTSLGGIVAKWNPLKRGASSVVQRIVGTASGEMAGWSVSMMYNSVPSTDAGRYNPMIAVGSPFYSKSVAEYDFSKRTFAERAAGVPIYNGETISGGPDREVEATRTGASYHHRGLTCEGRVTVWQYTQKPHSGHKHYYSSMEFLPRGNYAASKLMMGTYPQSEMGYSVAFSKTGDYLAVGCPGTDGRFDVSDCEQLTAMTDSDYEGGAAVVLTGDQGLPKDQLYKYGYDYKPDSRSEDCYTKDGYELYTGGWGTGGGGGAEVAPGFFKAASQRSKYGIGSVKTFRYIFEGKDGEAARREHYLGSDKEDFWIKYGPTINGTESPVYLEGDFAQRQLRYARPNFQDLQGLVKMPKHSHHERFGTDVSIIDVISPIIAVGAPYAQDAEFNRGPFSNLTGLYYPTGRVDIYSATPTRFRDNVMPFGGGASATAGGPLSSRTKTKFEYDAAGSVVASSGGGREAYFIAPNVSGSGLADDNALKSSRKTFGTGGINFTSSD